MVPIYNCYCIPWVRWWRKYNATTKQMFVFIVGWWTGVTWLVKHLENNDQYFQFDGTFFGWVCYIFPCFHNLRITLFSSNKLRTMTTWIIPVIISVPMCIIDQQLTIEKLLSATFLSRASKARSWSWYCWAWVNWLLTLATESLMSWTLIS